MKLFEFEAKDILGRYGIATPQGEVAASADEVEAVARRIGRPVVLKSQILVSGRGKAGGIVFAADAAEARTAASRLIGSTIKGTVVHSLLVEEKLDIVAQLYASLTVDRQARRYVVLVSTSGGVDIEETAMATPDKILRHWIEPDIGFDEGVAESMLGRLSDMEQGDITRFARVLALLHKAAMECDAELVETNPLVRTSWDEFVAADARMIVDDNALFRHPELEGRRSQRVDDTPREAEARQQDLTYVDLSGDIGIIGNGAGLVMATMDLVNLYGGRAANFLDIGGGARAEMIEKGLVLVMSKPEVKAVLVNVHGGITRCDVAAEGIAQGLSETGIRKPVVARMMGTNAERGAEILQAVGVKVYADMETAAQEVIKVAG